MLLKACCQILFKFVREQISPMRALPLKHPAHALRCPSQSGDLKVKCPSNRTLNVNGPLVYQRMEQTVSCTYVRNHGYKILPVRESS